MNLDRLYQTFLSSAGVTTDTRSIEKNQVFFALKGPSFNGNEYAQKALEAGASAVVIDEDVLEEGPTVFRVENVLVTLQELARIHRSNFTFPVIGLTGSNGKTTAKELFRSVLSQKFSVHATKGNLNNHIGVPLTILNTPTDTELAIVEMGANHKGEIRLLSSISNPDIGYITNFGKAHLEGFGGVQGVIEGKSELYENLRTNQNIALVNTNDPIQVERTEGLTTISYGSDDSDWPMDFTDINYPSTVVFEGVNIESQLTGNFQTANIGAAVALGKHFGISTSAIQMGINSYKPENNRSQWTQTEHNRLMLDAYNANPNSMEASIRSFTAEVNKPYLLILGDMFELGDASAIEHQNIADLCDQLDGNVILVGEHFFKSSSKREDILRFKTTSETLDHLKSTPIRNHAVLLKGSRGMKLETLVEVL